MAKRLTIELLAMIALGLLIGLLGPFGTFNNPPAIRMLNWVMWLLAGYVFYRPTGVVAGWLCDATDLPTFGGQLIALIVASVPVTLVVTMMAMQMSFGEALRWPGFWTMYLYISIVSAVVVGVMGLGFRPRAGDGPPPAPETPITAPAAAPLANACATASSGDSNWASATSSAISAGRCALPQAGASSALAPAPITMQLRPSAST